MPGLPARQGRSAGTGACAETDIKEATHRLVALIDGLSVEAVLYPARVPPGRQVALLDQLLRDFAKPPLHPARTLAE